VGPKLTKQGNVLTFPGIPSGAGGTGCLEVRENRKERGSEKRREVRGGEDFQGVLIRNSGLKGKDWRGKNYAPFETRKGNSSDDESVTRALTLAYIITKGQAPGGPSTRLLEGASSCHVREMEVLPTPTSTESGKGIKPNAFQRA